jgi:hypothetical protein
MNRTIASMTASILNLPQYRNRLGRQIMAETPETNKPDFRNGFPIRDLGDGSMILGQATAKNWFWPAAAMRSLPSAPTAPTTVARSQKA